MENEITTKSVRKDYKLQEQIKEYQNKLKREFEKKANAIEK